jgi:hypothetical protein
MGILLNFTDSLSFATPGAAPYQTLSLQSTNSVDITKNGHQRARVLYDYDAKDATELSLMADEVTQLHQLPTYILESNLHTIYSFRGPKNQVRITIACGLDLQSRAVFWKNDRAAVRAVRTMQYNNLFYLLLITIYYSSDLPSSLITESLSILRRDCARLLR